MSELVCQLNPLVFPTRMVDSRGSTVGNLVDDNVDTPVTGDTNFRGKISEINTNDRLVVSSVHQYGEGEDNLPPCLMSIECM